MTNAGEKERAVKKEPFEINCTRCNASFRLWVPAETVLEWEKGARISCVKCGAHYVIKTGRNRFSVTEVHESQPAAQAPKLEQPQAAQASHDPNRRTVILLEDDKLARDMVEDTFKDLNLKLIIVKNAAEAFAVLQREKVDLLVTDLYLKNPKDPLSTLDGEDFLRRVVKAGLNLPSIITTGKYIIDDLVLDPKWYELHVKGFIQKGNPFWTDELKLKVKEVLHKS